mmetsp:Transcript_40396/g.86114  ORF Transcript_40396/g.86114 Transcript_40396/m.86114 type:complete len:212 (-) Transcript_40396:1111-1746(-)
MEMGNLHHGAGGGWGVHGEGRGRTRGHIVCCRQRSGRCRRGGGAPETLLDKFDDLPSKEEGDHSTDSEEEPQEEQAATPTATTGRRLCVPGELDDAYLPWLFVAMIPSHRESMRVVPGPPLLLGLVVAVVDQKAEAESEPLSPMGVVHVLHTAAQQILQRKGHLVRRHPSHRVAKHGDLGLLHKASILHRALVVDATREGVDQTGRARGGA